MLRNNVGYLFLLGFLGLLAIVTGNPGFYGFFGFFGFLPICWGRGTDERVYKNIDKACRSCFIFTMTVLSFFSVYTAITRVLDILPLTLVALFVGNGMVFCASFIYYDRLGD